MTHPSPDTSNANNLAMDPQPDRWTTAPGGPLAHEALLTLARKVQSAAADEDPSHLEQAARHLRDALASHVRDEAAVMIDLPPEEARIFGRGQKRLLSLIAELVDEAAGGCRQPPERCQNRTEELLALLVLQARDEQSALHDRAG